MTNNRITTECPSCGQMLYIDASQWQLSWDDRHKRFEVKAVFQCWGCGAAADYVKLLPVHIEKGSTCSCGNELVLKSYNINRTNDDIFFEGIYQCDSCNEKEEVNTGRIKERIRNIWSRVSKIQIGPVGIEIKEENDTDPV